MKKIIGIIAANLLVSVALIELFFAVPLAFPKLARWMPLPLMWPVQKLYIENRPLIMFDSSCMDYDAELTYGFKKSVYCRQGTGVFENEYKINTAGFRDDEASLASPPIIAAGDSHAMGWGVEGEDTFSQVLERSLNVKVLNTGVASYGTSREMRNLERVDTGALKYLLVQYCDNDYQENHVFHYHVDHMKQNVILPRSREAYLEAVRDHRRKRRYYFGKYTFQSLVGILRDFEQEREKPKTGEAREQALFEEVAAFLNALQHGARNADLENVRILVFQVNGHNGGDGRFLQALNVYARLPKYPPAIRNLRVLDFSGILKMKEHFYRFDDHLNRRGHETVANHLREKIQSWEVESPVLTASGTGIS